MSCHTPLFIITSDGNIDLGDAKVVKSENYDCIDHTCTIKSGELYITIDGKYYNCYVTAEELDCDGLVIEWHSNND